MRTTETLDALSLLLDILNKRYGRDWVRRVGITAAAEDLASEMEELSRTGELIL